MDPEIQTTNDECTNIAITDSVFMSTPNPKQS